eukprot:6101086-Pleurochrysis_carterae.AAC.3
MAAAASDETLMGAVDSMQLEVRQRAARILQRNGYFTECASMRPSSERPVHEDMHPDGKLERTYRSGRAEILYATGTRKEVLPSGLQTVFFSNGDIKQTAVDGRVVYYYAEAETTHVSEPDGMQLYHFPNQQA